MQFQRLRLDVLMRDNTKPSFYTAFRPPKTLFCVSGHVELIPNVIVKLVVNPILSAKLLSLNF